MRYRPFGSTHMSVSAISLALTDVRGKSSETGWRDIVITALENGVNTFEIVGSDPSICDGLGEAIATLERHLLFVALRLGPTQTGVDYSASGMSQAVEACLARTGLNYLDAVFLQEPPEEALSMEAIEALKHLRDSGRIRQIGVTGDGPAISSYISCGHFDALATSYSLLSGWVSRNRLRDAIDRDMAIFGFGFYPDAVREPSSKPFLGKRGLFGRSKAESSDEFEPYAFLHDTDNWTAEEICLAFALTQPALCTVQLTSEHVDRLAKLAEVTERELPPGLAPRIEMARFGSVQTAARA